MKRMLLFAVLALVLTACGDDATGTGTRDAADLDLAGLEFVVHQAPG